MILTEPEINKISGGSVDYFDRIVFARAIEAALLAKLRGGVELPEPYATLHHDDGYFTTNQREHDLRYSGPLRTKVFTRDQVNTLLADNSLAAEGKLKLDRYVWEEYTGHEHGWCEYRSDGTDDPRLPEHKQYQPDINWINPYQIRNFRALYSKPSKESI